MSNKTKYQIRKVGARAGYFTSKLAVTPFVAVVDTGTAAVAAAGAIVKVTANVVTHLVKAPFTGAIRGHQVHRAKFGPKYAQFMERNTKLASGELVETVVVSNPRSTNPEPITVSDLIVD
jgi:hypothetical protein